MAPEVVVINNSAVDIYWFKPTSPNGLITNYQVYRSSSGPQSLLVHSGPPHVYTTIDASVDPGVQYRYLLEAVNSGGAANSSRVTVTLPPATPDFIPAITNFTALSSDSIYAEWDPLPDNSGVDQLRVLVGADDSPGLGSEWPVAATARNLVVGGLSSFTRYSARLAACLRSVPNGCGTGPVSDRVRTLESPPADQLPPFLTSIPDKSRGDDKLVKRYLKDDAVLSIFPSAPRYLSTAAQPPRTTHKATSASRMANGGPTSAVPGVHRPDDRRRIVGDSAAGERRCATLPHQTSRLHFVGLLSVRLGYPRQHRRRLRSLVRQQWPRPTAVQRVRVQHHGSQLAGRDIQ